MAYNTKQYMLIIKTNEIQAHCGNCRPILKDQVIKYTNSIVYIYKIQNHHQKSLLSTTVLITYEPY